MDILSYGARFIALESMATGLKHSWELEVASMFHRQNRNDS